MSSRVCASGHMKDPVPLNEKRRGLSPSGRFPPSFIHQVIIITGRNKFRLCPIICILVDADFYREIDKLLNSMYNPPITKIKRIEYYKNP